MTLRNGQVLASRYRLERRIAVGGMGEVWEATDTRLERPVAVKMLKPELSGDEEFRYRFHTEARLTASLNHPGIAQIHDYGETAMEADADSDQEIAYLVMELVAGEPLSAILARDHRLPPDRTLDILEQTSEALQAAHDRGLVHRDIKPGNILITPNGRVKITDFGIAKAVDAAPLTRQGMVMGTAHYIAPEQAAGDEAGPACDVYSLAVVGYECLAGRRPFQSDSAVTVAMMHIQESPPPLSPAVPAPVRALIEAALVKNPQRRYQDGGEFAGAVSAVRAGHWPPMPAAMNGAAATEVIDQYPRTALLPPGSLTAAEPAPPRTGAYPGGYRPPSQASPRPPRRGSGRRPATAILVALFVVLALILGAYLLRDLLAPTASPEPDPTQAPTTQPEPEPEPTTAPPTEEEPEPTTEAPEPTTDSSNLLPQPGTVSVILTDYLLKPGDEAADIARDKGLEPRVVDGDGDEIDEVDQSACQITGVTPAVGWVEPGSTIELTCEEG